MMVNEWLEQIAAAINSNLWLAPLLALLAGVLTSVTPCSLSNVPLIIGFVGGIGEKNTKKAFAYSATFALGTAVTFITLGIIASSLTILMARYMKLWYILLGVLMLLMALQIWEIFNFIPSVNLVGKNKKRGFVGAFLAGILGGIFSSPCSTPVLIALLAIVSGKGNLFWGMLLMLLYSVGHSALVMVAGTSMGFVRRINESERYGHFASVLKIVMGAAILLVGLYMFWLAF